VHAGPKRDWYDLRSDRALAQRPLAIAAQIKRSVLTQKTAAKSIAYRGLAEREYPRSMRKARDNSEHS
jgi:hypothetical protein